MPQYKIESFKKWEIKYILRAYQKKVEIFVPAEGRSKSAAALNIYTIIEFGGVEALLSCVN